MKKLSLAAVALVLACYVIVVHAAASYPTSVKAFTTRSAGDVVQAAHVNDIQDEVTAIETGLINGLSHHLKGASNNTYDLGVAGSTFRDLNLGRNAIIGGVITNGDGAVGAPGYAFTSDPDTGIYRSGTNALDFATAGVKALGIDSTNFIDSPTQPRAKVYKAAAQSIPDATETALTYDTESAPGFDIGNLHDTGSNTNRITIPTGGDGLYVVCFSVGFASNATGIREAWIKNQAGSIIAAANQAAVNGDATYLNFCGYSVLAAADWVESRVYQNSGGARNVGGDGGAFGWFFVVKLW